MKLGVRLESMDLPLRRALAEAQRLGVTGVQLDAVGDLSPMRLSQTGRRELKHLLRSHSVELTALGCPLRQNLDDPQGLQERLDFVRAVMELAFEMGPRLVVLHAGTIPEKADESPLYEALLSLAQHGDRVGAVVALETGTEPAETLSTFLGRFDTGSLGVNFDPANLFLRGFDPVAGAKALHRRIVHAHAKDARTTTANRLAQEVPLGHGDLDWMLILATLEEVEFHGWMVVEQEVRPNLADVAAGVGFLRRFVG